MSELDGAGGLARSWHHFREAIRFVLNRRGGRNEIRRRYEFRLLRRLVPVVGIECASGLLFVATDDEGLGAETYEQMGFDERTIENAVEIARRAGFSFANTTLIDVGANVGVTTVPALTRFDFGAVIAIEPAPRNARLLEAAVAANGLQDKVTVFTGALSDAAGSMLLELSSENSGDHRLRMSDRPGLFAESTRATLEVPVRTLSSFDFGAQPPVGLLWIDVQGHEAHVLAGAGALLGSVPTVLEYWPYGLKRAGGLDRLHSLVASNFETVHDLKSGRVMPAADVTTVEANYANGTHTDLLLLPSLGRDSSRPLG